VGNTRVFAFPEAGISLVILNGGEAGVRDITLGEGSQAVDGTARCADTIGIPASDSGGAGGRTVPRRACALLRRPESMQPVRGPGVHPSFRE
jgi:hypothetical protein